MLDEQRYIFKTVTQGRNLQFETLEQIKTQTTRTNGRVLELEKRSVGLWMANHQAKSALIFVSLPCILISDIRHPVVEFVVGLFF